MAILRSPARWWLVTLAAAMMSAGQWLREPVWPWTLAGAITVGITLAGLVRLAWRGERPALHLATGMALVALAAAMVGFQRRLVSIEDAWPEYRAAELERAAHLLTTRLDARLAAVKHLADQAAAAAAGDRDEAFVRLERAVATPGPELAVVVLEPSGAPWAWAGRHWERPRIGGDSIGLRSGAYWKNLEVRRAGPFGRRVVAGVLLWSEPHLPTPTRPFAAAFREESDVDLEFTPPDGGAGESELVPYVPPGLPGAPALFDVRLVSPEQGQAKESTLNRGRSLVAWALVLALILAMASGANPTERYGLLVLLVALAAFSPLGASLGLGPLFSPATYFHSLLGPLSASAGVLALAGVVATAAGISVWERRLRRRVWSMALGAALLLAAPYLISELGRGITPPVGGVRAGLWMTWQMAMVFPAAACVAVAAALFRGSDVGEPVAWRAMLGAALAIVVTLAGVALWGPGRGWRDWDWYPLLWALPLFLVALPAPRWAMITGLGVVAGSAATLVTWGEDLNGRLQVAARDVRGLGRAEDPVAPPLLRQFGDDIRMVPLPNSSSELYILWRGSELGGQGYPTRLALWSRGGAPQAEIGLDSLDVPASLVSALVRTLDSTTTQEIVPLFRVPGMHYLLLERLAPDRVLSVVVGPRSRLIAPDRLGRLLGPSTSEEPPYELSLSPPEAPSAVDSANLQWSREGWELRSDRHLLLPGGIRHVHAHIDLRGPVPILVRGALVVLADTAMLGLLWWLAFKGGRTRPPPVPWRRVARSFQGRLAITLALFFVVPVSGFTVWNLARLRADAQRGRDLLITQGLRDAVLAAGGLLQGPPDILPQGLRELGGRLDAELALYSGGGLEASSSALLTQLGLVDALVDPEAFRHLALADELEVTRTGRPTASPIRVGYRVLQPGPPDSIDILATPQPAASGALRLNQVDLALVLVLATLVGLAAATAGAQFVARALSQPVATLRQSALAVGRGQAPVEPGTPPPVEFEAVFGAFDRMAADIRHSQAALEAARQRTASVLATVATGVIAVDETGHVLLANQLARDLLGLPLAEGVDLGSALPVPWQPLQDAIHDFPPHPGTNPVSTEFEVSGRRLRVQLTALGTEPGGIVIAVDDLTGIAQAERILAWGEMARQVAHEIKNPLTPIRLGVQHLRRAYRDRRGDFSGTLDETTSRILAEIDRLDAIARGFSRFSAPAAEATALETVELVGAVTEVVQLYSLSSEPDGKRVRLEAEGRHLVQARANEVKEVLVNLLENARNAGAREVVVRVEPGRLSVEDDGTGISPDLLPRIFEPRFSPTTSGAGLGLAIVRRLVSGWGASIEVASEVGRGTLVSIRWPPA